MATDPDQPADDVTQFITAQMLRAKTPELTLWRDQLTETLARPKPWKRPATLQWMRDRLTEELASRSN
jgi:hypothetical protein